MRYTLLLIISLLLLHAACQPVARETEEQNIYKDIDSTLKALASQDKFSGNILIETDGEIVLQRSYGYADRETKRMLNDSSIFELASVSKQFTAAAVLLLQQKGLLSIADTVKHFLPEFPYPDITIYQLLTHTAGLPEYEPLVGDHWDTSQIIHNADVLKLLVQYRPKLIFTPGSRMEYSDAGYILLALIVERVVGAPFADFMREQLLLPLGMRHSFVYSDRRSQNKSADNYALGYIYDEVSRQYRLPDSLSAHQYVYYLDGIEGEGKMQSSTRDLLRWHQSVRDHRLLQPEILNVAFSKAILRNGNIAIMQPVYDSSKFDYYGFGYFIEDHLQLRKILWHSGGFGGYRTYAWHAYDRKISFIMLANTFSPEAGAYRKKIVESLITYHTQ